MTALASERELQLPHKQLEQQLKRHQAAPASSGAIATANASIAEHKQPPIHHIGSPPLAHLSKRSRIELIGATNDHNYANLWAHQLANRPGQPVPKRQYPPTAGAPSPTGAHRPPPGAPTGEHMDDCMAAMVLMFLSCRPGDDDQQTHLSTSKQTSSHLDDDMIFELQQVHQVADSLDEQEQKCNSVASKQAQIDTTQVRRFMSTNTLEQLEHSSHQNAATISSSNLTATAPNAVAPSKQPKESTATATTHTTTKLASTSSTSSATQATTASTTANLNERLSSSAGQHAQQSPLERACEKEDQPDDEQTLAEPTLSACFNLDYETNHHRHHIGHQYSRLNYELSEHFRLRHPLLRHDRNVADDDDDDDHNDHEDDDNNNDDEDQYQQGKNHRQRDHQEQDEYDVDVEDDDDDAVDGRQREDFACNEDEQPHCDKEEVNLNLNLSFNLNRNLNRNRNHNHHQRQLRLHLSNPNKVSVLSFSHTLTHTDAHTRSSSSARWQR